MNRHGVILATIVAAAIAAPGVIYPIFFDEAVVLRVVRLRIQSPGWV